MSDNSAIQWTDATWNPVRGCTKVSPGCANCYAETFAERFRGVPGHPYEQGFDLRLVPEKLTEPLKWKKPRRVFVNSMSDLFQDGVPDSYIGQVFTVMSAAKQHTFQVLTKRAARMRDLMTRYPEFACPNIWLGVSVENQHFADERIPLLLQTPAAVRFISAEPLLGRVDLRAYLQQFMEDGFIPALADKPYDPATLSKRIDWVIVGGESGHGARPFDLLWAQSMVGQCQRAGVPVFVKQLGANPIRLDGDHVRFHNKKGGDMAEWPAALQVREFPAAKQAGDD